MLQYNNGVVLVGEVWMELVFGVGVVVYVVPAVEKKHKAKVEKTHKRREKKTRKVSAEKSNASGLSLSLCDHAEARKKCFAVLIRTRRALSCSSFLFSSFSLSLSPFSLLLFPRQKESSKKAIIIKYISLSLSLSSIHPFTHCTMCCSINQSMGSMSILDFVDHGPTPLAILSSNSSNKVYVHPFTDVSKPSVFWSAPPSLAILCYH